MRPPAGVGTAAVQIPRMLGAEVFGTASASKHDVIREPGVTHPTDYRTQDFEQEVKRITGGEGIDLAFDAEGPKSFRKDYRLLRPGGRLVMYGLAEASTGRDGASRSHRERRPMPTATFPWWKSLGMMNENKGVFGLNMLAWWTRRAASSESPDPRSGRSRMAGYSRSSPNRFPSDRAGDAHRLIAERRNIGKVVLVP